MQSNNKTQPRNQGSRPGKAKGAKAKRSNVKSGKPANAPVAMGNSSQNRGPRITGSGPKILVCHSELIGKVSSNVLDTFEILKRLRVNPGSKSTFNWCSHIALCFESYRFRMLKFRYEPKCATTTRGSVISAYDYDAADDPTLAPTEQSLYNDYGSKDTTVWSKHVNLARPELLNKLYKAHVVMSDGRFATTTQDEKTIDAAQFLFGADSSVTTPLGNLFVDYEVELWNPQQVTESGVEGGAVFDKTAGVLPTTAPFPDALSTVIRQEPEPILKMMPQIPGLAFPNATVGQFLKDWSGVLDVTKTGSTLSSGARAYVAPFANLNLPAGSVGDVVMGVIDGINFTNIPRTQSISAFEIVAKAGDILKLDLSDSGVLTGLLTQFGASSAF